MPKKIKFESFKYQLLIAAHRLRQTLNQSQKMAWVRFLNELQFSYTQGLTQVRWSDDEGDVLEAKLAGGNMVFYMRGDNERFLDMQKDRGQNNSDDAFKQKNAAFFDNMAHRLLKHSGIA
jgi:hypothetical protein